MASGCALGQFTWKGELWTSYNTYRYSWRVQAGFVQISCQAVGHCIATNCVLTFFFFWKMKISSIIFVQMTLCQSAILVTQSTVNIFFGKLSSINIFKTKLLRQYIWFYYYIFFKNKITEFGSNCYICPKGSYDKVICIFFPGCSVSFLEWHTY